MRKVTLNKTRLSNVVDNRVSFSSSGFGGSPPTTPSVKKSKRTTSRERGVNAKRSILRKRRKVQLNLHYLDGDAEIGDVTEAYTNTVIANGGYYRDELPSQCDLIRHPEPDWTMQDISDLVYVGQRKRVELVRWCSLLSERGRAERIDIIARVVFPVAFLLFNFAYWSIYLGEDERPQSSTIKIPL